MINKTFHRTLFGLILLFSCFLVIGNIYIYKQQRNILFDAFSQSQQTELKLLSQLAKESLITENYALIEWFFKRWGEERKPVISLSLKSDNGFSIIDFQRQSVDAAIDKSEIVSHSVAIILHDETYWLNISSEATSISQLLKTLVQQLILVSSIATLMLGVTIWYLFKYLTIRPLLHEIKLRHQAEHEIKKQHQYLKTVANELEEKKQHFTHLAHHDPLTSLPNRLLFTDRLEQASLKSKRTGEPFALLFIDLDQFKQINDSVGHSVGDAVLIQTAKNLQQCIRADDTIARIGGDEFTIILSSFSSIDVIITVAQKVIHAVQRPMNINGKNYYITPSIGISLYPQDTDSIEMLIRNADSAMFKVKEQGRNAFQFYTEELTHRALKRVEIENAMHNALINKHFVVWYQPQYEIASGKLVGMEALVRWEDPELGIISPVDFIPLAEESGQIIELGKQILDQVMRQAVVWHNDGLEPGCIAVNLSGKQLFSGDITTDIKQLLEKNQCRVEWIDLEVTEGFFMTKSDNAIKCLHELHKMGFHIALDDFGTGYSSLAYLKDLPISKLKIDRSFVKALPFDRDDIGISRAVIALADGLKLDVIAEGVETKEQAEFLLQQGCPLAQGFFYSKPLPAEEITRLIQAK
ncbi:MAG: EAL domain-containing protein [Pseudomonadota bacterium]